MIIRRRRSRRKRKRMRNRVTSNSIVWVYTRYFCIIIIIYYLLLLSSLSSQAVQNLLLIPFLRLSQTQVSMGPQLPCLRLYNLDCEWCNNRCLHSYQVAMGSTERGLWMTAKSGFEKGSDFIRSYNKAWFASDDTTRVSMVVIEPDKRRGGLTREYWVHLVMQGCRC